MLLGRLLIYLSALMGILYFLQNSLMFYPERLSFEEVQAKAERNGLQLWPHNAPDYQGFISESTQDTYRGTVIVLHGNAGAATDRIYYVQALEPLGYRVILHEYPGYGAREGEMDEQTLVKDACETLKIFQEQFHGPVYLFGESIGSAVAAGMIANCDAVVDGVALITPWDNLPDLAQQIYWFLPVKWLVRDNYDNRKNLQSYRGRKAVLVAEHDSIIPPEHAQHLYNALSGEKRLWIFEGADHNSWPARPRAPWWTEVMDFLDQD